MREKFEPSVVDHVIGLEIFASQKKIDEFSDLYNKLVSTTDAEIKLSQEVCEAIANNLMHFDTEKDKMKRLEMTEKLLRRVFEDHIMLSAKLFESLVSVFTESQQWRQLIDLLSNVHATNCTPDLNTYNFLKKNLLYCFEP